jgi:hypothetical protein
VKKKWCFTYITLVNGFPTYTTVVKSTEEHPVTLVKKWHDKTLKDNKTGGAILISFQEVDDPFLTDIHWSAS